MPRQIQLSLTMLFLISTATLEARSFRVAQIPNGGINGCANCHVSSAGGGARTAFGEQVRDDFLDDNDNVIWGPELAALDADGDGFSNGHELQDPFGVWTTGTADPGNSDFVTAPGSAVSAPEGESAKFSLRVEVSEMGPHVGQYFEIRVVDDSDGSLVASQDLAAIPGAEFDMTFDHVLVAGSHYDIDIWADHSGNGTYDAPPTDHAWRINTISISDNLLQSFAHSTDFTDIGIIVGVAEQLQGPSDFRLGQNFPNPFNPSTSIDLELSEAGYLELVVHDLRGVPVSQVYAGWLTAGQYRFHWNATDLSSKPLPAGSYFYTASIGGERSTRSMLLIR